jgi:hypothetical protein
VWGGVTVPRLSGIGHRPASDERALMRPQYGEQHQRTSKALIADHRMRYGDWCPGIPEAGIDPHPDADLVADHEVAGRPEHGYTARCRRCNSKRRALGLG